MTNTDLGEEVNLMSSGAGSREPDRGPGWMKCLVWAVCGACEGRLEVGQWQALTDVPDVGRRWVHEVCALALGVTPDAPDPGAAPPTTAVAGTSGPVRIVVIGSGDWPRERAVEVRDALEAVARGHGDVVIVHGARRDPRGRLSGVDAWAALTAQRLDLTAEAHDSAPTTVEKLRTLRPTVVVAFPLEQRDPVETLAAAAEHAGVPVLVHRVAQNQEQDEVSGERLAS